MTVGTMESPGLPVGGQLAPPHAVSDGCQSLPAIPRWKRAMDLTIGALALVVLSPVILAAAAMVKLSSRGPVLFRQTRIGRGEQSFTMLKFRTMQVGSDAAEDREAYIRELRGAATADGDTDLFRPAHDPRITSVGRFLRRFSIDELPQLFNVIRGDMSLVGPRPNLPWEAELLTEHQRRRHRVLPGITGLWQVSGRNRRDTRQMLALDVRYVERCSLRLDLNILLRTPRAVLFDRYTR